MLTNKVVVITGGAGLIGQSFSKAIVDVGGTVIIADKNMTLAEKACSDIKNICHTANIEAIYLDITSKESIISLIESVEQKFGRVDALVNNAYPRNKNYGRHFFEVEYSDFCENINLNLGGYFLCSQQFGLFFKEQGYGNIINISSIYGVIAPKFEVYENTTMSMPVEYAAIKSALLHLTKYMAKYFKGSNIRVNAISPGGIFDNQPEPFLNAYKSLSLNKGMLDKSDITGTLVFLLSDLSEFVNGQNIIVDDGFTL